MPTFTNNGTKGLHVINTEGKQVHIEPGEQFTSYLRCNIIFPDVTLDSEDPYLDEVIRFIEETFAGAETKVITLTDDEVKEATQIVMYAGGAGLTAEVRLNDALATIRRKLDVNRGVFGTTLQLGRKVKTIRVTSNQAGTLHAYIER